MAGHERSGAQLRWNAVTDIGTAKASEGILRFSADGGRDVRRTWTDVGSQPSLATKMADQSLIVSNPPQDEVDFKQAARLLDLTSAEVRMKANYPVPEIWLADTAADKMEETAQELRDAGLRAVVFPGRDLCTVPPQVKVKSFSFTDDGLIVRLEDSDEVQLPYDTPIVAVFCQPHSQVSANVRRSGGSSLTESLGRRQSAVFLSRDSLVGFGGLGGRTSSVGLGLEEDEASKDAAFLDIYVPGESELRRFSVIQKHVEFSGLGEMQLPRASDNMVMLVAECEDRFTEGRVDRRLMGMYPRQRPLVATLVTTVHAQRKSYSFATEALARLLESISPDLKQLGQLDLSSRLAYLTSR